MSQPEKTGILYDQIIRRVIEDSRERFESEGADMQVLGELQKVSSVHGASRARARTCRCSGCYSSYVVCAEGEEETGGFPLRSSRLSKTWIV